MILDGLLPTVPFEIDCEGTPEDGAAVLRRALDAPAVSALPQWRVRGTAVGQSVRLWYTLRGRPQRLAPQLHAEWLPGDGRARLVGSFRQEPRNARLVLATGGALLVLLIVMAGGGQVSWPTALVGGALLAGYPWIGWFMTSHHIGNIESFVREALAAAPVPPAAPQPQA